MEQNMDPQPPLTLQIPSLGAVPGPSMPKVRARMAPASQAAGPGGGGRGVLLSQIYLVEVNIHTYVCVHICIHIMFTPDV